MPSLRNQEFGSWSHEGCRGLQEVDGQEGRVVVYKTEEPRLCDYQQQPDNKNTFGFISK
jgi:hypothetical protein